MGQRRLERDLHREITQRGGKSDREIRVDNKTHERERTGWRKTERDRKSSRDGKMRRKVEEKKRGEER